MSLEAIDPAVPNDITELLLLSVQDMLKPRGSGTQNSDV
jgi:hypothetical protein